MVFPSPSGPHRRPTPTKKVTAPPPGIRVENAATQAFRRNEDPQDKVSVPYNANINFQRVRQIAAETATYIHIPPHTRTRSLLIWGGTSEMVARAKSLLEIELSDNTPSTSRDQNPAKWAKLPSLTPQARRINEKELDAEDLKQTYRTNPPPEAVFEMIVSLFTLERCYMLLTTVLATMPWPSDVPLPEDVFGDHLQALDAIRLECDCYVTYNKDMSEIQAMGKMGNARKAIERIRASLFQLIAQMTRSTKTYVLQWESAEKSHLKVETIPHQHTQIIAASKLVNPNYAEHRMAPRIRRPARAKQQKPTLDKNTASIAKSVKDEVMQTLNKIKYYRGTVSFHVRLGTFVMTRYERPEGGHDVKDFEKMLLDKDNCGVEGTVTNELGDRQLEAKAWSRLVKVEDFLETQSTFVHELSDIPPTYTAMLTLDPNDGGGFVQLSKSWKESDNDLVEKTGASWNRLRYGESVGKCLLRTCVVNLEDGLSWAFEIDGRSPVDADTLSPALQDLGLYHFNIKQHEARDTEGTDVWCEFEKNENGKPRQVARKKRLELCTSWEFGIKNSYYTVEVMKTQMVRYDAVAATLAGQEQATVFEPRWEIQVKHQNWELNLAENANLGVGCGAGWRADLETWFPMDDSFDKGAAGSRNNGHVELMEKLIRIQSIIKGENDKMQHGKRSV